MAAECERLIYADFNPLRREGGDVQAAVVDTQKALFQSTPPRGRRRRWQITRHTWRANFNPLRREGGDVMLNIGDTALPWISIHSAARAETITSSINRAGLIFQSTPPRGRRHGGVNTQVIRFGISIHSAARAETTDTARPHAPGTISIHSAARAETLYSGSQAG